jgi:hypothetical protein
VIVLLYAFALTICLTEVAGWEIQKVVTLRKNLGTGSRSSWLC